MRRLVALSGFILFAAVAVAVLSSRVGSGSARALTVTPPGFNVAIEAEAVRAAADLTRGLVGEGKSGGSASPQLVGLTQPRRQYVVAVVRYPASAAVDTTVYAVMLLRNSTDGYRVIEGVATCDRTGHGAVVAMPAPGPDVILVIDADRPVRVPFGSEISAAARLDLQAWLDPRHGGDEPSVHIVGQPMDAPSCVWPTPSTSP